MVSRLVFDASYITGYVLDHLDFKIDDISSISEDKRTQQAKGVLFAVLRKYADLDDFEIAHQLTISVWTVRKVFLKFKNKNLPALNVISRQLDEFSVRFINRPFISTPISK